MTVDPDLVEQIARIIEPHWFTDQHIKNQEWARIKARVIIREINRANGFSDDYLIDPAAPKIIFQNRGGF